MPTIALGAAYTALLLRITRASVQVLEQDYVRMVRAKGGGRVTGRHSMLPVVTQTINAVYLLGGSALIETIFALPGIGSLLVESIRSPATCRSSNITLVVGLLFIVANLGDRSALLDPESVIRYA